MKIGIISDTHGNVRALRKALEHFDGADLIVHAGDVLYHPPKLGCIDGYDIPAFVEVMNSLQTPIVIAQGNCDAQVYEELLDMPVQSPYAVASFNGISILATHGHLISQNEMAELGRRYKANYFISGHTHIPVLENVDGVIMMNPGSPSIPKCKEGGTPIPSVGIITETGAKIINIEDGSILLEI
jgi:putative phosphoesterase